tara:strand:+ start:33661 stop:33795 length:135 start_codon:yes stop_codon:yes gene_type:complete
MEICMGGVHVEGDMEAVGLVAVRLDPVTPVARIAELVLALWPCS